MEKYLLSTPLTSPQRGQKLPFPAGVMFPSPLIGAGPDKYACLLQSHLTRELMQVLPFPTDDKSQMLVGFCVLIKKNLKNGKHFVPRHFCPCVAK